MQWHLVVCPNPLCTVSISTFGLLKVLCIKTGRFVAVCAIISAVGVCAGLVVVAASVDGGSMSDVNSWLFSIPFLVGIVGWMCIFTHCLLRSSWQWCRNCTTRLAYDGINRKVREEAGALKLTTEAAKRFARTTSSLPMEAENSVVMVDDNGNEHRQWLQANRYLSRMGVLDEREHEGAQSQLTAEIKLDQLDADAVDGCYKDCLMALLVQTPMVLIGLMAILLVVKVAAVLAFIPLMVIFLFSLFLVGVVAFQNSSNQNCLMIPLAGIPLVALLVFCVIYPLALDGDIPNSSTGDWALAMSPLFLFSFVVTVTVPCISILAMIKDRCDNANGHDDQMLRNVLLTIGTICWCGTVSVFNLCLIALCYKASGNWDLMSYSGIAATIVGTIVAFVICFFCLVVTFRE